MSQLNLQKHVMQDDIRSLTGQLREGASDTNSSSIYDGEGTMALDILSLFSQLSHCTRLKKIKSGI